MKALIIYVFLGGVGFILHDKVGRTDLVYQFLE